MSDKLNIEPFEEILKRSKEVKTKDDATLLCLAAIVVILDEILSVIYAMKSK